MQNHLILAPIAGVLFAKSTQPEIVDKTFFSTKSYLKKVETEIWHAYYSLCILKKKMATSARLIR